MGLTTGHFTLATSYSRTACRRTTIGAAAFHFRVRNGNGWCHCATVTRTKQRKIRCLVLVRDSRFVKSLHRKRISGSRFSFYDSPLLFKELLILWYLHTGSESYSALRLRFNWIFHFPLLLSPACAENSSVLEK